MSGDNLEWPFALAVVLGVLFLVLISGEWIALALSAAAAVFLIVVDGVSGLRPLGSIAWNTANSFVLTAVPLFLLMGEIVVRSGVSANLYRSAALMLNRVPGGLLHANVVASGVLAAMSGSSVATSAAMASVAIPEMDRAGYDRRLAFSSLTGGGSLGQLIPPSLGALIYGAYAELSVGRLFIAGVVPGLLLMFLFSSYIAFRVVRQPTLAPQNTDISGMTWKRRLAVLFSTLPAWVLVAVVLGSIYLGVATPTEAAGIGAAGAILIGVVFGDLSWDTLRQSAVASATLAASLIFIVVGAQVLSAALVVSGATRGLAELVASAEPSPLVFFFLLVVLYVVLGAFVDGISLILVTLPVLLPLIDIVGVDPYIFGIALMLFVELGQITPPVGVDLFVIKGVATDAAIGNIFRGAVPIALIILTVALLTFLFPEVALWLADRASA